MRSTPSSTLTRTGVMAVLRAPDARLYEPVVRALTEGGVRCIELTLTTPGTIAILPQLIDAAPEAEIGVGTVLAEQDARAAVEAGARFLVSPGIVTEVAEVALAAKLPVYPGAMTPTEVNAAWKLGASAVKIFPAATVGPGYIGQLAGPYPDVLTLPSGGVALDDIPAWIAAGCIAVSLGGPLLGDAFSGGSLPALRDRAAQALDAVERGRRP
ncbi:bifunctional 4-hydroxy-2-oxoglutarate aldolase/2-dehydro-3-deoxy-phosphogluconate aldolase [Microbacterium oxydans]|uniref:bifunctional 4-hydroxy-2-oxoglutarate aldolase/2-dehydro-3-deoxy-phosphogluconate aldolase n=1 Tax=Microbacterium oxydans TaxID=82380 RepID=UPI0022B16F83|nr:bifunctional 4-hydroxy-2-oxoglutarate aldolase/2-dehydro-3-deoxy-phosphogluconate aldolase [Microbacterium oxydans]MCZ4302499.1 bifunctional 4-hydroxy-2-oxoglutarate aldolase/2-dehydro-3-deoxy-phosphogluconate aldolase [Microbacterium oxydans]